MENNAAKPMMSFGESVKTCLTKKYFNFDGRARRSEYWWYSLAISIVSCIIYAVASGIAGGDMLEATRIASPWSNLFSLVTFCPSLGVCARRLHDTGKSGWWMLISITIIGIIPLLLWLCKDSDPQANKYGESPKY